MVKIEEDDEKSNLNLPFRIIDMYASLFKSILYLNVIGEFLDYLRIRNIYIINTVPRRRSTDSGLHGKLRGGRHW